MVAFRLASLVALSLLALPQARADLADRFADRLEEGHGIPGCHVRHMNADKRACHRMKMLVLSAETLARKDPADFEKIVLKELKRVKGAETYNYPAILIATLSASDAFRAELKRIAELEKDDSIGFKYATKGVERLEQGSCAKLEHANYHEICEFRDRSFETARVAKARSK